MEKHQQDTIDIVVERFKDNKEYSTILLAGSLAHGTSSPRSDVDIIFIATEEEYSRRKAEGKLTFALLDICKYDGGYVDCKVTSVSELEEIAEKGSDPSRYAYKDSVVLYSRDETVNELLNRVTRYPVEKKEERRHRFLCQMLAWKWYFTQGQEKDSPYLIHLSTQKFILFACRAILNTNELLYPFHKWLLAETALAKNKPEDFDILIDEFCRKPDFKLAQNITDRVLGFYGLEEGSIDWPNQFMIDSEKNWIDHEPPVDDL